MTTNTDGSKAAQPAAKPAAASSARQPPQRSAKSSAKPAAATAESADAAFRHFFAKLSTADIQRSVAATAAPAAAVPAASAASVAAIPASALAVECYRQLHSSMPQLHAHHLDALRQWLSDHFSTRILPHQMVEAGSGDATPFRLSTELLEAVRTQARLPPVHSRIAGSGSLAQVTAAMGATGSSAAADPDEEETPSFAEALAADAGKATAALSKRRGAPLAATAATASSASAAKGPTEVSVVAAAAPIDARMAAAASLYAVLLVQSLPLLVNPSAATSALSPHAATPAFFLRAIPLSLAAEARREAEQRAAHLAAAVRFEFDDDDGLADSAAQEVDPEQEMLAYESDADDFIFTADPVPEDSDCEDTDGEGGGGGSRGAWGSLDSIPVEAHAIEEQVLRAQRSSAPAGAAAAAGAESEPDWACLQAKVAQLVSLWDAELFAQGHVVHEQRLGEQVLALWRACSRPNSRVFRAGGGGGAAGGDAGMEWLRERVLRLLLAQMLAQPHGGAVQGLLQPCVQELLQLPQLVPGLGDPSTMTASTSSIEGEGERWSQLPRWDPERTLLTMLSQLCTATTPHPFPSNPAPAHSAAAAASPSTAYLHTFLAHNLPWLSLRLEHWAAAWTSLLDSGRPLRFEHGVRERLEELHALCNVLAFFMWNHPARAGSAAASVAGSGGASGADLGSQLVASGVVSHLLSLVLMSNHAMLHSHHASVPDQAQEALAYCSSCREYEQTRAETHFQVDASVAADGTYSCAIKPCVSVFAPAAAFAAAPAAVSGSVALPSAAASHSSPLHVAHQLLLLCTTYSPAVARLLASHPLFPSWAACPCYEEGHALPAVLFPLFISANTRALDAAQMAATAADMAASTAASATPVAAAAPEAKKKGKEKKSKLVVAAIESEADEKSSDAASAALDQLGWNQPSASSPQLLLLLASLKRSLFVVQQACAQLPTPETTGAGASSSSSSQPTRPLASSPLSVSLQLLVHVVQHVYLFAFTSPQHKLLLTQLAAPGPASALSTYSDPGRAGERAVMSQLVGALLRLRLQLPHVSNLLSTQLQQHNKPSAAAAALDDDHDASPEQQSELLTALAAETDSVAGHEHRHVKQTLEQCHSAVQRLQQWLKTMVMEVAKKD